MIIYVSEEKFMHFIKNETEIYNNILFIKIYNFYMKSLIFSEYSSNIIKEF